MEKVLLVFTAVAALTPSSLPARTFHFVDELKTWTEAQSYCREHHTDLVTMENMDDVTTLNNMTQSSGKLAWIGLYDDVNSWRWSMSDLNQHETEFRNWYPGNPDNYGGGESCGEMFSDGSWNDVPCSVTRSSVCMETSGLSVTFQLINTLMTWTGAQSYCREHHTDLASVRNVSENQRVKGLAAGLIVWIGLFRDTWKWSDGGNSSFRNWNSGEPNGATENCALANFGNSGKWEDWNCNNTKAFVCYRVSEDCFRGNGADYKGDVFTTEDGDTCQRWDAQEPQSHKFLPEAYPHSFLEENFCRNPDDSLRPWCYTTNPSRRWRYCAVPSCTPVSKTVVRLKLVSSSSVDLNGPAVLEDLLKQLKQKLGVNVNLMWRNRADGQIFYKDKEEEKKNDELSTELH